MAELVEGSLSRGPAAARIDRHRPLLRRRRRGGDHLLCPAEVAVGQWFSSGAAPRTRIRRTARGTWARDRLRAAVAGVGTFMCARSAKVVLLSVVLSLSPMWCRVGGVTVAPTPAPAEHDDSLWDTISGDPDFSKLTACLEVADPSVMDLLKASPGSAATAQPLTLFAPTDLAFEQPAWRIYSGGGGGGGGGNGEADHNGTIFDDRCRDEQSATALVSYHVSTMASATPYIGEEFPSLLGEDFSPLYYGIPKSPDVPAELFPIQFVDSANVTATPTVVGGRSVAVGRRRDGRGGGGGAFGGGGEPSYLFPVDRVLRPPVGTIWKTLCSDPSFSLLAAALNSTSLAATLDADGGGAGAMAYTLFAPDDDAIKASPEFPQDDPEALEVLLSFHTLAAGVYPLSLSGAHFSQQLYKVDPTSGSLSRDYYREFYADSFEDGQFTSLAGPLLNVSRASSSQSSSSPSCLASQQRQQEDPLLHQPPPPPPPPPELRPPVHSALSLLVEGVPVSEADITATNGVVHRLSAAVMAPPDTVAGVLLNPPFPLSAAGGGGGSGGPGSGFGAIGELVRLAWPLVNTTLTEEGPLTVLAPTDAAFDIAIAAGDLPPRPWYEVNSTSSSSSSPSLGLTPERAARLLLSHTLRPAEGEGPLLFAPTAGDPFASGFTDGDRLLTAAVVGGPVGSSTGDAEDGRSDEHGGDLSSGDGVGGGGGGGLASGAGGGDGGGGGGGERGGSLGAAAAAAAGADVEVGVRVVEVGTRSAVAGTADGVADREVYVDGARVFQCVDGTGVGHDCGTSPRPSNTYALNGAHLCAVHAVDRVMFPADPSTDLAAILDGTPSLSRFAALLREHGLLAPPSPSSPSSSSFFSAAAAGARPATLTLGDSEVVVGGSQKQKDKRGGGRGGRGGRGRGGHRVLEGSRAPFLTVFAPTNAALARLEMERPWLFRNSTAAAAAVVGDAGGKEAAGERGVGDADDWSPVRELLAYHLVPGAALFSRYFNESSPPTRTLALGGTAPVAATFITAPSSSADGRPPSRAATVGGAGEGWVSGTSTNGTGGTLRVNLQTCSSTDRPASDGVLHVLAFDDGNNARGAYDVYGRSGGVGSGGSAAGVLVPDVLELTYAYGFRATYEAIVATAAAEADGLAVGNSAAVADALRGRAPHTLLAVASVDEKMRRNPREKHASSPSFGASWWVRDNGAGISADTLRYQTLIGDQPFGAPQSSSSSSSSSSSNSSSSSSRLSVASIDSVELETLLGEDVHLFNNSENPGNPFYSPAAAATNMSGLNVNQAEVLRPEVGMAALNGRIHQISEPLRVPAPDVFSLLSSHPQLTGWADWVELTGLAELLSDPTAGPFTVFAPVDSALEQVAGLMTIASHTESLTKLVRFHVALGTATTTTASRLFTPSLANATAEERSALSGDRFVSGPRLWTLPDHEDGGDHEGSSDRERARMLSVQIAAAGAATDNDGGSGASAGGGGGGGGVRVFVGPDGVGQQHKGGGGGLFLGAFTAEVVLPDLNAVNGVVHGISGVMTYPGYVRPTSLYKR